MGTQVDYRSGVGNFVCLIFSKDYQETNPGVPAKSLMETIGGAIGHVDHIWGEVKIIKFFWDPRLDRSKVNEALNSLRAEYPSLKIQFKTNTVTI